MCSAVSRYIVSTGSPGKPYHLLLMERGEPAHTYSRIVRVGTVSILRSKVWNSLTNPFSKTVSVYRPVVRNDLPLQAVYGVSSTHMVWFSRCSATTCNCLMILQPVLGSISSFLVYVLLLVRAVIVSPSQKIVSPICRISVSMVCF